MSFDAMIYAIDVAELDQSALSSQQRTKPRARFPQSHTGTTATPASTMYLESFQSSKLSQLNNDD